MADLTPDIAGEVLATCRESAEELVAAVTRALDSEMVGVTIGDQATYDTENSPDGFDGPGLAVVLKYGDVGASVLLPESSGLLPDWYAHPDPTGKSKLSTLAQELSMLLMPSTLTADDFQAYHVEKLTDAMRRAETAPDATLVPITLKCGENQGQLSLVWPLAKPGEMKPKAASGAPTPQSTGAQPGVTSDTAEPAQPSAPPLPKHTRSFFKVRVPVSVNLATQKQTVQDIIDLVPGSIIKFDKSCDELLDLVVGDQMIAAGEVVKVGDKFGLRIRNIVVPQEQFVAIKTTMPS